MENQTRFDLNAALESWRQELAAQPNLAPEDRRELEEHLANLMAELSKSGMNEKEAFRLACLRIGSPKKLNKEFMKGRSRRWNLLRVIAACVFIFFCCSWGSSHYAKHSLFYGWSNGNISVLVDRGIVEFQLNRRDTEDDARHANDFYNPRVGFESGFEWDEYRRHACSGRESLKTWGPKTGFTGFLANWGFASWSMTWGHLFGSSSHSREVFAPFWFLVLIAVLPVLGKSMAIRGMFVIRHFRIRLRRKEANSLWKIKPVTP